MHPQQPTANNQQPAATLEQKVDALLRLFGGEALLNSLGTTPVPAAPAPATLSAAGGRGGVKEAAKHPDIKRAAKIAQAKAAFVKTCMRQYNRRMQNQQAACE